jgi:hypothetical protein
LPVTPALRRLRQEDGEFGVRLQDVHVRFCQKKEKRGEEKRGEEKRGEEKRGEEKRGEEKRGEGRREERPPVSPKGRKYEKFWQPWLCPP